MKISEKLPVNYNLLTSSSDSMDIKEVKEIKLVNCSLLNTNEYEVFTFYKATSKILNSILEDVQ